MRRGNALFDKAYIISLLSKMSKPVTAEAVFFAQDIRGYDRLDQITSILDDLVREEVASRSYDRGSSADVYWIGDDS